MFGKGLKTLRSSVYRHFVVVAIGTFRAKSTKILSFSYLKSYITRNILNHTFLIILGETTNYIRLIFQKLSEIRLVLGGLGGYN